jgi:group II intron reverse transcriptase/maturase
MSYTDMADTVDTKLAFLSQRAAREPQTTFNNIMHLVNEGSLEASYYQLGRNRAKGVDDVSWQEYGQELAANIKGLLARMVRMGYRPQPVRRVCIPKDNGDMRPLGIPATEDKVVQRTMSRIMEAIYEQDFHGCSYGFRPKRSPHQALRRIANLINFKPINHVMEADIKGFFDSVSHTRLMELISKRITDKCFLRYLVRFLKAGYLENDLLVATEKGTPQGGNLSPLLANIFLHYVLDEWFVKEVKPHMRGQCYLVRYCDDFVILVQFKAEAEVILRFVRERFKEYGLQLHTEKTRRVSFGRYEKENAKKQKRKANTFDFLGFTHYCGVSRKGEFKVCRKTAAKRFGKALRGMKEWLKTTRNSKIVQWWQIILSKIRGHYQYYGVSENMRSISLFYHRVVRMIYKWLNRRSQKKSFNWSQFNEYLKHYPIPRPYIVHSFYA